MFETEREMSGLFECFLKMNFGNAYIKECPGLFGVPDFICYAKDQNEVSVVSFELKLMNWKQAAKQAFRHKSFSNMVYVVMDSHQGKSAARHIELFEQYNIGLACFDKHMGFDILYKPEIREPYSANLNMKVRKSVSKCRKKVKNIEFLMG